MSRPVAVLRPEPGNAATATAIRAGGGRAIRLPLFRVIPLDWIPPDPPHYDALLLTSANAARHAGAGLALLAGLPVHAVGAATAAAARAAGLRVETVGDADAATLRAGIPPHIRLLHLAGRDHIALPGVNVVPVYAAVPAAIDPAPLAGCVAMLHSARAARRLAGLILPDLRAAIRLAAISTATADAAGPGWQSLHTAAAPDDPSLVALALQLAD